MEHGGYHESQLLEAKIVVFGWNMLILLLVLLDMIFNRCTTVQVVCILVILSVT